MQIINFWHKLHIYWTKIILLSFVLIAGIQLVASAQLKGEINLPNSDEKKIKYGFLIGIHNSNFKMKYADIFATPAFDSVHSINPKNSYGFSLGLVTNFRIAEYLDLRITPSVGFYGNTIRFTYTDPAVEPLDAFTELTRLSFPVLVKYKSDRRGNTRMYFIGGITPSFRVSGNKKEEEIEDRVIIQDNNVSVEFGFGIDLYYPLFRFSPEIRFSKGLTNLIVPAANDVSTGISRLSLNTITLYLQVGD